MNWRDGESNPKILQHYTAFFQRFDHGAALKTECKMSHINIAFDRYASIGTVMRYILVINIRFCLHVFGQVGLPQWVDYLATKWEM